MLFTRFCNLAIQHMFLPNLIYDLVLCVDVMAIQFSWIYTSISVSFETHMS